MRQIMLTKSESFSQQTLLSIAAHSVAMFARHAYTGSGERTAIGRSEYQQMSITRPNARTVTILEVAGRS